MSTFQYDALEVLNRAQRSADDWWSNTLNNAKKRTDLDQTHMDNAFKNDERQATYAPKVWATNAENMFKGTKAQYDTMLEPDRYERQHAVYGRDASEANMERQLYDWSQTPENSDARRVLVDNKWQTAAANLEGDAAAAGIADRQQAAQVAAMTSTYRPGALSAQAGFGRQATDAGSFNIGADIATGNFDAANKGLWQSGAGMTIEKGRFPGTVIIRHGDGTSSVDMDQDAAARYVQDRTGQKPGQAQKAFADERSLNTKQQAENQKRIDDQLDDERKQLMAQYTATVKESGANSPEARAITQRLNDITRYRGQTKPAPSVSMDQLIMGNAPAAQQGTFRPQAPTQAMTQAPAPAQVQPKATYAPTQAAAQAGYWTPESGTKPTEAQIKALYDRWQSLQPSWYMPKPASSRELDAAERAYDQALARR